MNKELREYIKNQMELLDITEEEAIEMWKYDNGEIDNAEAKEIEDKEEENKKKTKKETKIGKIKNAKAKAKADADKEAIIEAIRNLTDSSEEIVNAQWLASNKVSFKGKNGNYFTISITKHKNKPEGYAD